MYPLRLARRVISRIWNHPANEGTRGRALLRAGRWQLHKRIADTPVEFDFAEGFIGAEANIGVYSMLAAALANPSGRVIAFEPFATDARRFQKNVDRNGFARVTLHREVLSDAPGEVKFVTTRDVSNRIQTCPNADADMVRVPCTTLDVHLLNGARFAIGKMGLEGSEIAAMRGPARKLVTANPPMWEIELDPGLFRKRGHDSQELDAALHQRLRPVQRQRKPLGHRPAAPAYRRRHPRGAPRLSRRTQAAADGATDAAGDAVGMGLALKRIERSGLC